MGGMRGTIQADYSKFVDECKKAEDGLAKIESQGAATEQSLNKMEESVASGKISDAIAKTVTSVDKVGQSAKQSETSFGQLADAGRNVDKILGQFGVSLGPTIGSLDELSKMSTQTVGSLGKLGTAISIAGAAMAGWKIGRWIAELTGADDKIADFANTLMGRGSVAAETYGAKLDVIQKAIRDGYSGLPTYDQALKFNAERLEENVAKHTTGAGKVAEWTKQIAGARGGAAALRAEIEAGNLTNDEMVTKFKVSERAIDYLKKQMDEEKRIAKEANAEHEKTAAALARVADARQSNMQVLASLGSETVAAIKRDLDAGAAQADLAIQYGVSERAIRAVADARKADAEQAEAEARATKLVGDAMTAASREAAEQQATSLQQQRLAIGTWRADTMAALAATKGATVEQYEAIDRIAQEKLASVGVNWNTLRDGSKQTLRDQYEAAEITYQRMKAASDTYTAAAIANAQKDRDAKLAAMQAADQQHSAMYAAWLAREKAFSEAVTKYDTQRAGAAGASIDAQQKALDDAIAYAQAYGVSLEQAQRALGQLTDKGTQGMRDVSAATQHATSQVQQLAAAASTAYERAIAGANLLKAYSDAGVAMSGDIGLGGYNFDQLKRTGVPGGMASMLWAQGTAPGAGQQWGNQNTLTVNVNSSDAGKIAEKLVGEMKSQGYRL